MTRDRDVARDRDIERVLEHWLTDGVNEMPDRVYQSIFDRVERQPQALAPRLLQRLPQMNDSAPGRGRAAVVLIAVVGFAVLGRPLPGSAPSRPRRHHRRQPRRQWPPHRRPSRSALRGPAT